MPNDAKLGLLVGVLGVIVAAAVSADRTPTGAPAPGAERVATSPPATPAQADSLAAAPAALPADLGGTTPVRSRPEPDATPASRRPKGVGP